MWKIIDIFLTAFMYAFGKLSDLNNNIQYKLEEREIEINIFLFSISG